MLVWHKDEAWKWGSSSIVQKPPFERVCQIYDDGPAE